jgi:hypothetical protein
MAVDLFHNTAKSIPTSDEQIVRVSMEQIDIAGRKSHLPAAQMSPSMNINHVPNAGSNTGSK